MATTVSCIIITTLIVVSLANLLLLVHVIMNSLKKCDDFTTIRPLNKYQKIRQRHGEDLVMEEDHRAAIGAHKYMAAIIRLENRDMELICTAAIISRNWVVTAAHCAAQIIDLPIIQLRIASNSSKVKYGIWHDLDQIVIHEKYDNFRRYNDIALISVKQQFKGKNVQPIALPSIHFKYTANATAKSLGWMELEQLYAIDVKLFWYKNCELWYPDERIWDNGMFCAGRYSHEKEVCVLDGGGVLVQRSLLVGVVAMGGDCGADGRPGVFTKIAMYENWIKFVEKKNGGMAGMTFKSSL